MKNSDPIFWPTDDVDASLRQQMQKNYTDSITILQTQWYQADLDQRFTMGDQDIWGLMFPGLATFRRKMFNFNITAPIIQSISGFQRQSRKSTVCIPVYGGQQKTADQLTKCLYHVHNKSGVYQVYSDAFEQGALTQGMGLIGIYPDYSESPISPDIRVRYIDFKSVLIDPYFRKHDLTDCRFIWTRQFFEKSEAAALYPQYADKIMSMPKGAYRDDKFYYMPEVYQIQFSNLIAFDEYWYLSTREATYIVDRKTQETQEWNGTKEDLDRMMSMFGDQLAVVKKPRQTVRRSLLLNDRVIRDEQDPYGIDRYPYVPSLGYFTPDTAYYAYKFRGVTRDLRDAQYLFNRRKVTDLDILESQQQGLKVKKGSLVTPEDGLNQGNGRMLIIDNKFQMSDVEPMPIIPPSPVMLQMEEMLMNVVHRIAGVDPSAMGIDVDDKAGIISMMRQASTARNLQRLFDQFDECQRLCGDIMVGMIQNFWTYGHIKQVIGEEPTSEFDNKLFFKYGCKIVQGNLTETQNQLELAQLLHLKEILGDVVPAKAIINAMNIQNKDQLIEQIEANQKAVSEQQQQIQSLQLQNMQVENQTKLSYAHSQEGLAAERMAKITTDRAVAEDKLKRAEAEDMRSLYELVKALKELQGVDLANVSRSLQILNSLQQQSTSLQMGTELPPSPQPPQPSPMPDLQGALQ
jgi:hypothetical protein